MSARTPRPATRGRITLDMPIQFLKGVGERRAELLKRLNLRTAGDLLYHIPHRYEDASTVTPIVDVSAGQDVVILGRVISKGVLPTRKGLRIFQAVVQDASGMIEVSWPGQPFLDRSINTGDLLLLSGPCKFYHGRQLQPREHVNLGGEGGGEEAEGASGKVLSVYAVTEGLTVRQMRAIIEQHLDALLGVVEDYIPADVKRPDGLPPLQEALRSVHRPVSLDQARQARDRLAFDELFCVHLLHRRANALARQPRAGHAFEVKGTLTRRLADALPYALTGAQKRVIREITGDMTSPRRMHRLLQGDVGSGKTIVGVFAALVALENGHQVAMMAPTELLAEQHARTMQALLAPLGVEPVLVLGALGAAARRAAEERLQGSDPVLAVGTHALLTERTRFGKLGLAIIDEQHRFGVEQRATLGAKGDAPDVLLMSATPIPRSLALTIYGDLDVSTLDERPPGRQPVTTAVRPESAREKVMAFVVSQVKQGRQAYIVYPVIEESEKTDLKAATTMFAQLSEEGGALHGLRVALLHGRLPTGERDDIMRRFRAGEVDVLVATTVIEVGIDVANATVMIVEHPERFGLSQLHQLRGRVGRGAEESFCILLGGVGADAYQRLKLFASTEDGFALARADLKLRGMGDLLGAQQSGAATFRIADPIEDETLNLAARQAAATLMEQDPTLGAPAHQMLREALRHRFPRALELFRVG